MSGGQMMVVLIVAIVMVARVIRTRGGGFDLRDARRRFGGAGRNERDAGYRDAGYGEDDVENRRLREEVRALKERIAVLERIATDSSTHLDREIEALRDRPAGRDRV